jgi:non-ribosomal peptide synthetase component E (peptide arylation enzyme)
MASLEPIGLATNLRPALERKSMMSVDRLTIYDVFKRNARLFRDKVGLVSPDQQMTFGELPGRLNGVAGGLAMNGIREGSWIAI